MKKLLLVAAVVLAPVHAYASDLVTVVQNQSYSGRFSVKRCENGKVFAGTPAPRPMSPGRAKLRAKVVVENSRNRARVVKEAADAVVIEAKHIADGSQVVIVYADTTEACLRENLWVKAHYNFE